MTEAANTRKPGRPSRKNPTRTPVHQRNRFSWSDMDKDYVYRVVNDKDHSGNDKLQAYIEGGYEFVESSQNLGDVRAAEGSAIDSRVSKPVGNGVTGYLMRIKKEWYDEDQKAKQAKVDAIEASMQPKTKQASGEFDSQLYGKGLQTE